MLTECVVSSITGSYLELGIFTHMSVELLLFVVIIAYLYEFTVSRGVNIYVFFSTFTNPTTYDVRRDLVPLPILPHTLYSYLISSLDDMMMAYI